MKNKIIKVFLFVFVISSLISLLVIFNVVKLEKVATIEVVDLNENTVLVSFEIREGEEFSRSYFHSLCREVVTEYFTINARYELVLTKIRCFSYDVVDYYSFPSGSVVLENDEIWVIDINMVIGRKLILLVSKDSQNTLNFDNETLPLYLVVENGTPVLIKVKKMKNETPDVTLVVGGEN